MPVKTAMYTASPPAPYELNRVLDIEKRSIVSVLKSAHYQAIEQCDVLIIGGGVGGVAAAESAAADGVNVILVESTSALGGQFTSQLVPVPDENSHVAKVGGASSDRFRALRTDIRNLYAENSNYKTSASKNIGDCWVSSVSGMPSAWNSVINQRLAPYRASGKIKQVYLRHQIQNVSLYSGSGNINYVDIVDLNDGSTKKIAPKMVIDATEDGSLCYLAGTPTRVGQESRLAFNEPLAPEQNQPTWIQSFTYGFLLQWRSGQDSRRAIKPPEYDTFKKNGEYTLDYVYRGNNQPEFSVPYKVLESTRYTHIGVEKQYLPFWTYRRLLAASSRVNGTSPADDIALINWRGNDFHLENYINKSLDEQVRILKRGRNFAMGFAYWLQNECPRDGGEGFGYPEMQLYTNATGECVDDDGFALHPYVRESRRIVALQTLTSNDMTPLSETEPWGTVFPDSIGCALYAIDIHPSVNEPHLLNSVAPYHIPLGSLIPKTGPQNLVAGSKNIGATRLAMASARMHPTEWLIGEVAGLLTSTAIKKDVMPKKLHSDPNLLDEFLKNVDNVGITRFWSKIRM